MHYVEQPFSTFFTPEETSLNPIHWGSVGKLHFALVASGNKAPPNIGRQTATFTDSLKDHWGHTAGFAMCAGPGNMQAPSNGRSVRHCSRNPWQPLEKL